MMDDLIRRQDAIDAVLDKENHDVGYHDAEFAFNDALIVATNAISDVPSAQKKGHWININELLWNAVPVFKCSNCGEVDNRIYETDSFCPNCGADMRGNEDG